MLRDSRGCWYGTAPVDSATASSLACGGIDSERTDAKKIRKHRLGGANQLPAAALSHSDAMLPTLSAGATSKP